MRQQHTLHGPPVHDDEATRFDHPPADGPPRARLGARDAFLIAHGRIADLAAVAQHPAVIVAAVTSDRRIVDAVIVEGGRALIVGRHSRCGLRLPASAVALRQLALLVRAEEGAVVTRLWDLNTGAPFVTEDGEQNVALLADGPVYAAVQGYALWIIPAAAAAAWPDRAAAAWDAMPRRAFIDQRPPDAALRPRKAVPPTPIAPSPAPLPAMRSEEISHVTLVGPALVLGDPDDVEVGWGAIRIEEPGRRKRHSVSAERLDRGVLVGRYDRCGLELAHHHVSRVHALLVKIGGDVWILDTASTNGLRRDGAGVDARILADVDSLSLGGVATLGWQREKHAEA